MSKKNKVLNVILVLLVIALIGYGIYFLYKENEKNSLNKEATIYLGELDEFFEKVRSDERNNRRNRKYS